MLPKEYAAINFAGGSLIYNEYVISSIMNSRIDRHRYKGKDTQRTMHMFTHSDTTVHLIHRKDITKYQAQSVRGLQLIKKH